MHSVYFKFLSDKVYYEIFRLQLVDLLQISGLLYKVGQKTGLCLSVDNVATVSRRKACDMSNVSKFCAEKV